MKAVDTPYSSLGQFIRDDIEVILADWDDFASSMFVGDEKTELILRDHARELLLAIASDILTVQSPLEQREKSEGKNLSGGKIARASEDHASSRVKDQFTLEQVLAEFRALRAAVLRRWDKINQSSETSMAEMTRFNEAVDEAVCASVGRYARMVDQSRDVIIGILAHDLRGPIQSATLSATYILKNPSADASCVTAAARTVRNVGRINALSSDLLDYARTRLGSGLPLNMVAADMRYICADAIDEVEASYPGRNIAASYAGDTSGNWDPGRIAQLLTNILTNAMVHGDATEPVLLHVVGNESSIEIEVTNQGPAIAAKDIGSLFQPLYLNPDVSPRAPQQGSSGLGLGLYISRQIALAHHGDLTVRSSIESGTTFRTVLAKASPESRPRS